MSKHGTSIGVVPGSDILDGTGPWKSDRALSAAPRGRRYIAKAATKTTLAWMADVSGLLAAGERAAHDRVAVLCYHRVLPEPLRSAYHDPRLVVTPAVFAAHCRSLQARYTVLPLEEALARWRGGEKPLKPFAAITFDDGYRDNAEFAAPILADFGLRATFFVIAGLVGSAAVPWYDHAGAAWQKLAQQSGTASGIDACRAIAGAKAMTGAARALWVQNLAERAGHLHFDGRDRIMTATQLRDLAAAGHEIGSHSMTHPLLPQCDDAALDTEIRVSRERLVAITGGNVAGFCYPNGDCDARVGEATRRAGYAYGALVDGGLNGHRTFDAMSVRRLFIDQDRLMDRTGKHSTDLFRMEVCGLSQIMRRWRFGR